MVPPALPRSARGHPRSVPATRPRRWPPAATACACRPEPRESRGAGGDLRACQSPPPSELDRGAGKRTQCTTSAHPRGKSREPQVEERSAAAWPSTPDRAYSLVRALKADESACTPGSVSRGPRGPRGGGHPSRTDVAAGLVRSTRGLGRAALDRPRRAAVRRLLLTLLQVGFTEPSESPRTLVVSYTTVSPLPVASRRPAVCFLWHCPAGHPGWALPTTLPCGARTFLGGALKDPDATARPARPPC